jgi:hypothetical protein
MSSATEYRERVEHYITHRKCFITSARNLQTFFLRFGFDGGSRFGRRNRAGRPRERCDVHARPYSCWFQACLHFFNRLRTAGKTPKGSRATVQKICTKGVHGDSAAGFESFLQGFATLRSGACGRRCGFCSAAAGGWNGGMHRWNGGMHRVERRQFCGR